MIELVNITDKHRESLVKILKNENVEKWLISVPSDYSLADADKFIEACRKNMSNPDVFNFAIVLDGKHIGGIGIRKLDRTTGTIGYYIDESHWRRGYAREAIRMILEFAVSQIKIKKVVADTLEGNEASELLLLNCGFKHIGKSHLYYKNGREHKSKRFSTEVTN